MSFLPEAAKLAEMSTALKANYVDPSSDPWAQSPFGWIKQMASRRIGAIGETLVSQWCESVGFRVTRTGDSDADRLIEGLRVEIKFSTLWTDTGIYKFQQIRDQQYEYCFCLGVSPDSVGAWFIPKSVLMTNRPPELVPQHGGSDGVDTKWLSFKASAPPAWLEPYGGTLEGVSALIAKAAS